MSTGPNTYSELAAQSRRDDLILNHLWLVKHILGRLFPHLPSEVDAENLQSAGTLGLVEATNKYDPERGIQFKTFAYIRIRGAILDEVRRNSPLPQHVMEHVKKVRKAYESMPPGVSLEELADATGLSNDEITDCLAAMRMMRMVSWEGVAASNDPRLASRADQPGIQAEDAEQKALLGAGIENLPERERQVVSMYYMDDMRLKEIGQVVGLSESRVSRLLSAALFRLGEYMRARAE